MSTGWYLYDHPNPHAPVRDNGIRFHGYPSRRGRLRIIGVHTAESVGDFNFPDDGAEQVAAYQSRVERPSSYHMLVDADTVVPMLPPEATSFGIVDYNAISWNLSFAQRTTDWNRDEGRDYQMMLLASVEAARVARAYSIPIRRLTKAQVDAGESGFVDHARMDPARRSDPGAMFDWDTFLDLVAYHVAQATSQATEEDMLQAIMHVKNSVGSEDLYHVAGNTAVHIQSYTSLEKCGLKHMLWPGTATEFVDQHIIHAGGGTPAPR